MNETLIKDTFDKFYKEEFVNDEKTIKKLFGGFKKGIVANGCWELKAQLMHKIGEIKSE